VYHAQRVPSQSANQEPCPLTPKGVNPSISLIITHMVRMLYNYHESHIVNIIFFWVYKKDFEGWDISWFRRLDSRLRYLFKLILRSYSVYTGPHRAYICQQLADFLDLDEAPEWPKDELREQGFIPASRFSKKRIKTGNLTADQPRSGRSTPCRT
jgi:hypothetical protein